MFDYQIKRYNLSPIDIELARKLKQRRMELKMTQSDVAEKLGVTRGNIAQFEMGRNKLKHSVLAKYAEILGKPVSYFTGDENKYFEDIKLKENPKLVEDLVKNWKIKKFIEKKKLPKNFIDELEQTIDYLCELYKVDKEKIW